MDGVAEEEEQNVEAALRCLPAGFRALTEQLLEHLDFGNAAFLFVFSHFSCCGDGARGGGVPAAAAAAAAFVCYGRLHQAEGQTEWS